MDEIIIENSQKKTDNNNSKIIATLVIIVLVAFIAIIVVTSEVEGKAKLTYENYCKISNGMSYSAVVKLLGSEGELSTSAGSDGYTLEYYIWSNSSSTKIISIGFENGRVIAKSQVGL